MTTEVTDHAEQSRYEIRVDGDLAGFADYRLRDGALVLPHTEVDPARRGQGLGATLVREALDDIRAKGLKVVPSCPFVATFIRENPEYKDLLADH